MTGYYANSSSENILELSNPDSYLARIRSYSIGHQVLIADISLLGERKYIYTLELPLVEYIELPTTWIGLNIATSSEEECWEMLAQIGRFGSNLSKIEFEARESLRKLYRLYQFRTLRGTYRVLAAHTLVKNPYDG